MILVNLMPGELFGFMKCRNVQYFIKWNQLGNKNCEVGTYGADPVVNHLNCKADISDPKCGEFSNPLWANLEVKVKPENSTHVDSNENSDC